MTNTDQKEISEFLNLVATTLQTNYENNSMARDAINHLLFETDRLAEKFIGKKIVKFTTLIEVIAGL